MDSEKYIGYLEFDIVQPILSRVPDYPTSLAAETLILKQRCLRVVGWTSSLGIVRTSREETHAHESTSCPACQDIH